MPAPKRDHIIQEAEKLAARGKIDAAVREYQRALEQAPHDTTTLNRLGDLLVKVARIEEAIDVYRRIGEHFAEDGFFLKAIAIYKKINRFDPQRTEIYERLADLYYKQGLAVEGRQQLLTLAEWFTRSRNVDEALRIYRRLAELEPGNVQIRAKLVDALIQRGDVAAVSTEIDTLGQSLLSRGMLDEALKLYHRALELKPEGVEFVSRCIDALVDHGRAQQAVDLATRAMEVGTPGLELTRAAALAHNAAGNPARARKLLEGVMAGAGDRVEIVQAYSEVLLKLGDEDAAKRVVLPMVDRLVSTRDSRRAAQLLRRLLKAAPGDIEVLERATRVVDRQEEPELMASIETALADGYFRVGRGAEALPLYRRLVEDEPDNSLFAERLASLSPDRPAAAPTAGRGVPPPPVAAGRAAAPFHPPAHLEPELEFVDLDLSEAPGPGEATAVAVGAPGESPGVGPVPAAPPVTGPAQSAEAAADELYTEAVVFAKYGLTDKATSHLQRLLELQPAHAEALDLLTSLAGEAGGGGFPVGVAVPEAAPAAGPAQAAPPEAALGEGAALEVPLGPVPPVDFGGTDLAAPMAGAEEGAVAAEAAPPAAPEAARAVAPAAALPIAAPPRPRRPSASGAIRVEDLEAALGITRTAPVRREPKPAAPLEFNPLELLSSPTSPLPAAPPLEWSPAAQAPPAEAPEEAGDRGESAAPEEGALTFEAPVEVLEEAAEVVDVAALLGGPDEERLREVDFLVEQGLLDEAGAALAELRADFPDHPEVVNRQAGLKARGWDEAASAAAPIAAKEAGSAEELFSEEEQFFDLAAELERELADEELVAEATGSGQSGEVSIEELFKEFQRGVAEQVSEQDFDTHFNLGLAYREMGLHDEAIGEFQLAGKSPDYLVECATMIGACYMDKGLPEQAAEWYGRALKAPGLPPEAELGLRYELGRTHEAAGNPSAALAYYAEVLAINPAFRDVVDRVSRLQAN